MSNLSYHDGKCELFGGWFSCQCLLRSKGRHPALTELDLWYLRQNKYDKDILKPLLDKLNEELHSIDDNQNKLKERLRP